MKLLDTMAAGLTKAVDYVVEKNRKAALINRVKVVIRNEEQNMNSAYVALGKYYFRSLRDENNEETERYCKAVENAMHRIDRAVTKLEELNGEDDGYSCGEGVCSSCECDCDDCPYDEDYDNVASLQDLQKLDGMDGAVEDEDDEGDHHETLHPELIWQEEPEEDAEPSGDPEEEKEAADEEDGNVIPFGND